jgi:hypothetical protein
VKILLVSNLYPPNAVGGYERLCATISAALAKRGHRLSVLTSDFGTARPVHEDFPVERTLRLLVSPQSIYRPFEGSPSERDDVNRGNVATLARKLDADHPDVVLVGNLYFLDRSILEALRPVADRTAYLLTDVWRIHFADDAALQAHFREAVFELAPGTTPLVPPDPPALFLERFETDADWDSRAGGSGVERSRRMQLEKGAAAGRAAYQRVGLCHLCGPTSFLVRRPGPATVMLCASGATEVTCARCGLGAAARATLHALDALATPAESERVLVVAADAESRRVISARYPSVTVTASLAEVPGDEVFRHAVWLGAEAPKALASLTRHVGDGGTVVLGGNASLEERPDWDALARARLAGAEDAAAYACWSPEYGYLGGEQILLAVRN